MRAGRFLLVADSATSTPCSHLNLHRALFIFDAFLIAPAFATGASSVKVERHVAPEPLADTSASPSPNASTIVVEVVFLVCISAADLPLAGRLTACIINDGSCPNTASCPYLSNAVGGTGLYRIPAGNSTIDPSAVCHGAASLLSMVFFAMAGLVVRLVGLLRALRSSLMRDGTQGARGSPASPSLQPSPPQK